MGHNKNRCILWVGDKHSGKTTAAMKLIKHLQQQGYTVGGILSPSVYKDGQLIGFDIIDIRDDFRVPLSIRNRNMHDIISYRYYQKGLNLGHSALNAVENEAVNLVIVDEYGPLELSGKGWRSEVDCLLRKSCPPILLVVRRELVDKVRRLYARYICFSLEALDSNSIDKMLVWLKERF